MAPNFSDMTYFMEVSRTLNISRAAERLGIAQPSLSSAIRRLEASLDVPLLTRGRTGVQLTKAGIDFVGRARVLLSQWEQLKSDVQRKEDSVAGKYILGCHPSVALYSLPLFLPELLSDNRDLEVSLAHDLSRNITEAVVSYEVDFGIVVNPVRHLELVITPLCYDVVRFWTAKKPSKNQDLKGADGVLICDGNLLQVQKMRAQLQKQKLKFKRVISSGNLEVIAKLTAEGAGIGILPTRVAQAHSGFNLQPASAKLPTVKDGVALVYRSDAQKTVASRCIIQAIKSGFAKS